MPETIHHVPSDYASQVARYGIAVQGYSSYVNTVCRPHKVDLLLLSYIVRGRARHVIADMNYPASAGSVGITRYGESHDIVTGGRSIAVYNLYLDPRRFHLPLVPEELKSVQQVLFPENDLFRNLLNRSIHFQLPHREALLPVVRALEREISQPGICAGELVWAWLRILVLTCCRAARASGIEPGVAHDSSVPRWVLNLCAFMDEAYAEPIDLNTLCAHSGLTRSHLCRAFKAQVGLTAGDYLTQRRISAAMQALRGTNEKILPIALQCGFNDLSHFNRTFKARVGLSPSAYRKKRGLPVARPTRSTSKRLAEIPNPRFAGVRGPLAGER